MLTFSAAYPAPTSAVAILRRAWLVALAEATVSALAVLLVGLKDSDPEIGIQLRG